MKLYGKDPSLGEYHRLVRELHSDDDRFHAYFRMSQAQFVEHVGMYAVARK